MKDTVSKVLAFVALLASPLAAQTDSIIKVPYDSVVTISRDSLVPITPVAGLPAGLAPVATHTCSQLLEAGFTNRNNTARIVTDPRGYVCEAFFRQGMKGGSGPVQVDRAIRPSTALFVSFYLYVSPHWQGHSSGVNKVLHLWIAGVNRLYLSAQGAGAGRLEAQVRLQQVAENPVSRNLRGSQSIPRGQWVRWDVLLVANTAGQANGSATWWIDGLQAGSVGNIRFTTGSPQWERVSWNPTWGGIGDTVRVAQVMRIDDLAITAGP